MAASEAIVIDRVVSRAEYFRLLMLVTLRKWYLIVLVLAAAALLVTGIVLNAYPVLFHRRLPRAGGAQARLRQA